METVNYQCPSCNGPLRFSSETNQLVCDYCGSTFVPEQIEEQYRQKQDKSDAKADEKKADKGVFKHKSTGDPIQDFLNRAPWADQETENLVSYLCSSCGAELLCEHETAVTGCPYCGNPTVIPGSLSGAIRPDYVIPFKISKEAAINSLKSYYHGKRLLPNSFKKSNHLEHIQGVYVPFWLYSGETSGTGEFECRNIRTYRQGKYQVTEIDHYEATRSGKVEFSQVPVDGSSKMPDAHMDAIEPFDYSEMVPFSVGYLPGFLTDRYDQNVEECGSRATLRMRNSFESLLRQSVNGYMEVSTTRTSVKDDFSEVKYALMPVWMLHTKWKGRDFLFAMNGQTGKLIGDLPISKGKLFAWFVCTFILVTALAFAAMLYLV